MGVNRPRHIVIEAVLQTVHRILDAAHDVAHTLAADAVVVGSSAGQAQAFLTAVVLVEGTVAGRLVGVEEPLYQEAGHTVFQNSQVAVIADARGAVGRRRALALAVEGDVTPDDRVGLAPAAASGIHGIHPVAGPACLAHRPAAAGALAGIGAAIQVQRVVGVVAIDVGVGVDRHEHVVVAFLDLGGNGRELAVVLLLIAGTFHIGVGPIGRARHGDVLGLDAHAFQGIAHLKRLPQVGVALVEATGVGPSRRGECRIGDCGHGAVVRAPTAVPRVDVDAHVVGRHRQGRAEGAHRHQQE